MIYAKFILFLFITCKEISCCFCFTYKKPCYWNYVRQCNWSMTLFCSFVQLLIHSLVSCICDGIPHQTTISKHPHWKCANTCLHISIHTNTCVVTTRSSQKVSQIDFNVNTGTPESHTLLTNTCYVQIGMFTWEN